MQCCLKRYFLSSLGFYSPTNTKLCFSSSKRGILVVLITAHDCYLPSTPYFSYCESYPPLKSFKNTLIQCSRCIIVSVKVSVRHSISLTQIGPIQFSVRFLKKITETVQNHRAKKLISIIWNILPHMYL